MTKNRASWTTRNDFFPESIVDDEDDFVSVPALRSHRKRSHVDEEEDTFGMENHRIVSDSSTTTDHTCH